MDRDDFTFPTIVGLAFGPAIGSVFGFAGRYYSPPAPRVTYDLVVSIGDPAVPQCHVEVRDAEIAVDPAEMGVVRWAEACRRAVTGE